MRKFILALIFYCSVSHGDQIVEGRTYQITEIKTQCIEFSGLHIGPFTEARNDASSCNVSSFKKFATLEGNDYYRVIYCLSLLYAENGCMQHPTAAVAIFVGKPHKNEARLLTEAWNADGIIYYGEPSIKRSKYGEILHVNAVQSGTGNGNASAYYIRQGETWRLLESESWIKSMDNMLKNPRGLLPSGLESWKGAWPDLESMTVKVGLYKSGDANCCNTGGTLYVTLSIVKNTFVIESTLYVP